MVEYFALIGIFVTVEHPVRLGRMIRPRKKAYSMHTYSMRGCPREHYIFYVSAAALAAFAIINQFAGAVGLTSAALFMAFFYAFDRFLWRIPGVSKVVAIPYLAGTWQVTGKTDGADGVAREWHGEACIEQTWSRIAISLKTKTSRSRSAMASLERDPGHGYRVIFGYSNTPKDTTAELRSHHGTCEVVFSEDLDTAEATYFNDHQRRTCGTMAWKRVPTKETN